MNPNRPRKNALSRRGLWPGAAASAAGLVTGMYMLTAAAVPPMSAAAFTPVPVGVPTKGIAKSRTSAAHKRPLFEMPRIRDRGRQRLIASGGGLVNIGAAPSGPPEVGTSQHTGDPRAALEAAIVGIARTQLGQTNAALYGGSSGEWCAAFVSWVYRNAGLSVGVLTAAYQVGTWAASGGGTLLPPSATPEPGDAVLFEPNGTGRAWPSPGLDISNIAHVNIVASVNPDGSFATIGGNESGGGVSAVRQQGPYSAANAPSWWGQTVYGFVRPG